ncbi:hypothetical protein HHK36_002907 [Tetracentron sinense]|uniref:Protein DETOXIFICATION n=1 Tax=Tetracentron sinense TaxID=13715 RepID=A0A834ZMV2_TETSI|nr:hypothetical protein HHK36_002907 [Tetracentron sinense]
MAGGELHEPLLIETEADIEEIRNCGELMKEAIKENKKLWYLAGPAIFTSVAQYSLGAITQVFAGHLTTLQLDAVSIENMVIAGLAYGIMLGMGSALETLCGQAFGAKQYHMLGVYMQRSWVILTAMCILLLPMYLFATPILVFFGEDQDIAALAGKFSLYMIPQLFAYGLNFPMQKFLQAQSKVMTMAWISGVALLFHLFLSWLLIVQFKLGLPGAAASLNIAWWLVVLGQFAYIAMGYCPGAWTGFSWSAFQDLASFAWLSVASAIMMCLEFWYYTFLVLLAGRLRNAQIAVAAISICTNLNGWVVMIFLGFNAAISVRISNELGAARPRAAKFSILVVVLSSALIGVAFLVLVLALRNVYALLFTNNPEVSRAVSQLAVIFAFTLLLNSVQPVLTGVAVGAGWQWLVAYVNVGCYYVVGVPLGFLLGAQLNMGVEAMAAESRIRKWGGSVILPVENIKNGEGKKEMAGGDLHDPLLHGTPDIEEIRNCSQFFKEALTENKKLWYLAGPAIFTAIAQYSLGAITQVFAGHLTTLELDAVSIGNSVILGLAFGIMDRACQEQAMGLEIKGLHNREEKERGVIGLQLGLGSALETLCGQAFGAKQLHMMGVYLQRSWIILNVMCIFLLPIYLFATPILRLFGQNQDIAQLAGKYSLYIIPQLFAYGFNFPIQKFLQAQSKIMTMAWVSGVALLFHVFLSWLLIVQFKLGLAGAAVSLNISWWIVVLGQFAYIAMGYCPGAWTGFSWSAFRDLGAFARLSIASAIMMWNAQIAVAAMSICTNLGGWEFTIFLGFNAAISVRISNELGAARPRAAKFSILVVVLSSALIGIIFLVLVLVLRNVFALPFTNSPEVAHTVSQLAVVFAFSLLLNSVQPVLTGVAIGAGWQWLVAYVNLGSYYIVGLPLGFLLGSQLNMGVRVTTSSSPLFDSNADYHVLTQFKTTYQHFLIRK